MLRNTCANGQLVDSLYILYEKFNSRKQTAQLVEANPPRKLASSSLGRSLLLGQNPGTCVLLTDRKKFKTVMTPACASGIKTIANG